MEENKKQNGRHIYVVVSMMILIVIGGVIVASQNMGNIGEYFQGALRRPSETTTPSATPTTESATNPAKPSTSPTIQTSSERAITSTPSTNPSIATPTEEEKTHKRIEAKLDSLISTINAQQAQIDAIQNTLNPIEDTINNINNNITFYAVNLGHMIYQSCIGLPNQEYSTCDTYFGILTNR